MGREMDCQVTYIQIDNCEIVFTLYRTFLELGLSFDDKHIILERCLILELIVHEIKIKVKFMSLSLSPMNAIFH